MLRFLSLPELREEASQLATTLLESTGLFEGCEWEIRCWLYPLCRPGAQIAAAVNFLDAVLQQARQKQLALTDEVADAIHMCGDGSEPATFAGRFSVVVPAVLQRLNSGSSPSAENWSAKPEEDRRYAEAFVAGGLEGEREMRRIIKKEKEDYHTKQMQAFQRMMAEGKERKRELL